MLRKIKKYFYECNQCSAAHEMIERLHADNARLMEQVELLEELYKTTAEKTRTYTKRAPSER